MDIYTPPFLFVDLPRKWPCKIVFFQLISNTFHYSLHSPNWRPADIWMSYRFIYIPSKNSKGTGSIVMSFYCGTKMQDRRRVGKQDHGWNSPSVLATRTGWQYKQKGFSSPEVEQQSDNCFGLPGHLVGLLHFETWVLEQYDWRDAAPSSAGFCLNATLSPGKRY